MTCASCAKAHREAAGQAAGVESASVNFAIKVATVKFDPAATSPQQFAKAVNDIGYRTVVPVAKKNPSHGQVGHDRAAMLRAQAPSGMRCRLAAPK